ncbi:AAA family ATPase [Nocardioides hungaricus]|jgi:predicted kinase
MLIVMAGLPGSGKSAVGNEVARALGCAVLSVDPIEAAMWRAGIDRDQPTGLAAYVVAEDLAREQLRLGNDVVVDAVNDVEPARDQWRSLSAEVGQAIVFVEVFCSDEQEHQIRLASRRRGIDGFPEPTWESVVARKRGFSDWHDDRVKVDSMRPLDELVDEVLEHLARVRSTPEGQPALPLLAEPPTHYLGGDSIIQTDDPDVVALGKELRD